jgi:hypothetical protein
MTTAELRPTGEQLAVIDACVADANVVVEAGAGTGKTSTLRLAASAIGDRRGVYLAFNRETADAARRIFPASVICATSHSLAFNAVGYRYADRLPGAAPRIPSWRTANILGIQRPLPLGERLMLTPAHLARIALDTVERFCHSAETTVAAGHVPAVRGLDADATAELTWRIVPLARQAWQDIQRPDGRLPMRHDHYLKIWQLNGAQIAADYVMFDEAQDANPVTTAILQGQRGGQQIIVGDSCQAIYAWRGAVDALKEWPCDVKLNLTQSFRFGPAIATEANKWLATLQAGYRLAGLPAIPSVVGTVNTPQVVVCRTNAEAFTQARAFLSAGRRTGFGGGARDLKYLAGAALDLQAAGRTNHPELAAFRSWGQVLGYIRTDAAGADLAASVRLIEKYGASTILATIEQLTAERRAEVVACTVHAAKGREWERVLIGGDFTRPADDAIPAGDAMLAYVAVTRARIQLDRSELAWIDTCLPITARTEAAALKKPEPISDASPLASELPRPYAGGRAQAESGCRIIATDYAAWSVVSAVAADDPRRVQLAQAWRAIVKRDLDDDPGPAASRYRILSHAAAALADASAVGPRELAALDQLATHARLHSDRLRATADQFFSRSALAGPYTGGIAQAQGGSRVVEKDYGGWSRSAAADQAARDSSMRMQVKQLRRAWENVRQQGLHDGPAHAAERYGELTNASLALVDNFGLDLPSAALGPVLDLASHAHKHATRLRATAEARAAVGPDAPTQQVEDIASSFELNPDNSDGLAGQSSADRDKTRDRSDGTRLTNREARVRRYSRSHARYDRER